MILIIDNYDSFTYNLKQVIDTLGFATVVHRNDKITLDEIVKLAPKAIVISPGPGNPDSAGVTLSVIRELSKKFPILGVCLGHQAIGQAFGGDVIRAPRPRHGKVSPITHDGQGMFKGVPQSVQVARYHSLILDAGTLPECLVVTATSDDGLIMGVRHRELNVHGVQFHPESIATENGPELIRNFLEQAC